MSEEVVPRVGSIGVIFTATVKKPDPNNPGQFIVVDLTAENGNCMLEFMRPDKSRFTVRGNVLIPKTTGQIQVVDDLGILNQAGLWRFRGIANFGVFNIPGSWYLQRVGV